MTKKESILTPHKLTKSAFIDGQKLVNETMVGDIKPMNPLHMALFGGGVGALAGGATYLGDTVANQFKKRKKSNKEKLKQALIVSLASGAGGATLGGLASSDLRSNKRGEIKNKMNDVGRNSGGLISGFEEGDDAIYNKGLSQLTLRDTHGTDPNKDLKRKLIPTIAEILRNNRGVTGEAAAAGLDKANEF